MSRHWSELPPDAPVGDVMATISTMAQTAESQESKEAWEAAWSCLADRSNRPIDPNTPIEVSLDGDGVLLKRSNGDALRLTIEEWTFVASVAFQDAKLRDNTIAKFHRDVWSHVIEKVDKVLAPLRPAKQLRAPCWVDDNGTVRIPARIIDVLGVRLGGGVTFLDRGGKIEIISDEKLAEILDVQQTDQVIAT